MSIADLRREYTKSGLLEEDLDADPIRQFSKWFKQALTADVAEPNAMTLATASPDGDPSGRIVLLKGFDKNGFTFFTNYRSRKARNLDRNPRACLVFFWKELERQVRIHGFVERISREESQIYFHSRPTGSQLGAWVSEQSRRIPDRRFLEDRLAEIRKRFDNQEIPLPDFWGGFRLRPESIEFWQGRPNRLHDRFLYTRKGSEWTRERLAP